MCVGSRPAPKLKTRLQTRSFLFRKGSCGACRRLDTDGSPTFFNGFMELHVKRAPRIEAEITVPGDKSISHRAAIIAALSNGVCTFRGFLPTNHTMHTLNPL